MVAPAGAGSSSVPQESVARRGYRHEAFFYRDDADYYASLVPFLREGIDNGEPVLVAVAEARADRFREELGPSADQAHFVDMRAVGGNPAHLIPLWQQFLDEHRGPLPGRGIGEPVWAGRDRAELDECARHEALLNLAFDEPGLWLVCPYDTRALADDVVEMARGTHPFVREAGAAHASAEFVGVAACADLGADALPPPPADVVAIDFDVTHLVELRRVVAAMATAAGLEPGRTSDMVAVVNELTTNSVEHGGGRGRLVLWRDDTGVVAQVSDTGRLEDPLAGRRRPDRHDLDPSGRGLWLVSQLTDLVQIRSTAEGTVIRVRWKLPVEAPDESPGVPRAAGRD